MGFATNVRKNWSWRLARKRERENIGQVDNFFFNTFNIGCIDLIMCGRAYVAPFFIEWCLYGVLYHILIELILSIIGHYVPQLAQLIIQSNVKFNLKGIAVSRTWNHDLQKNLNSLIYFMLCQITLTKQNLLNFVLQIGNPLLEITVNLNSRDEYYWSHGLISDAVYELLTKDCNASQIWRSAIEDFNLVRALL